METVTDVLKATGEATARKIAARLGIEVRDAVEMLREQQEAGVVEFLNGYWSLSGVTTKTTEYQTLETETPTVVKIGEPQMLEAIKKQGPQTADELATMFGITSRKVTSTLAMATGKGRLIREYQNGRYYYSLPGSVSAPAPEQVVVSAPDTDSTGHAATATDETGPVHETVRTDGPDVSDVASCNIASAGTVSGSGRADAPPAAPSPDVMALPSPSVVAKNLRRHKAQLARLQKARGAAQAVRRYGLRVTPAPKEIVNEIRRLTAIIEAGTKLRDSVSMAKKCLARINRFKN
ncbi:DUF1627 domain-containing protein [Salmonella enterica]|nr:DUF1627 domain-containing protein [Salmonella enterica]EHD2124081.1 DUF1627 domain-containing protein [Salmonella enterica]EJB2593636.1 DUF1627 domain-containing protein [Salmonella enterica]ELS6506692.1 DUF1627 domain-containing protein [Salmonella enterica]